MSLHTKEVIYRKDRKIEGCGLDKRLPNHWKKLIQKNNLSVQLEKINMKRNPDTSLHYSFTNNHFNAE